MYGQLKDKFEGHRYNFCEDIRAQLTEYLPPLFFFRKHNENINYPQGKMDGTE